MSEMSKKARDEGKAKVKRLTEVPASSVDASDYGEAPCGFLDSQKKLGNRPISKQNLASGGKAAHRHAGRKHRDMGGPMSSAGAQYVANVPTPPQNRFSFTGNQSPLLAAAGMKKGGEARGHWIKGAIKHPGALHKELGVPEGKKIPEKKLNKAEHSSNPTERKRADLAATLKGMKKRADGGMTKGPSLTLTPEKLKAAYAKGRADYATRTPQENWKRDSAWAEKRGNYKRLDEMGRASGGVVHEKGAQNPEVSGTRPVGGRIARAAGGKASKKGTNVTIIIAQKPDHQMTPGGAPPAALPPKPPMPMPPPGAAPQGAPAGPMPGGPNMPPPSMQQPPMGRASGGKVYPDMKYSAANGCGRFEKSKKYGA